MEVTFSVCCNVEQRNGTEAIKENEVQEFCCLFLRWEIQDVYMLVYMPTEA